MPYRKKDKTTIYIVMDKYSLEIFVNGLSMSNTIYPQKSSDLFELNVESSHCKLTIYK